MKITVFLNWYSQIFIGTDCSNDSYFSFYSTILFDINWRTYWILFNVYRIYIGFTSSFIKLEDKECERSELYNDSSMVLRRFKQNILLHRLGTILAIKSQPFQFVMCGIIQTTTDVIIVLQIFNYSKNDYSSVSYNAGEWNNLISVG